MTVLMKARYEARPPTKVASSTSDQALQKLLQHPIRFVLATSLTLNDEAKAAPARSIIVKRRTKDVVQPLHHAVTYTISPEWQRQLTGSVPSRGLRNPGSWCYHNSVFQALLHAPKVVNWLNAHRDDCTLADCLACSLASFCIHYWDVPVSPQHINAGLRAFRAKLACSTSFRNNSWSWYKQHDAEEFYTLLISAVLDNNHLAEPIIKKLFQHDLTTAIICPNCQHASRGRETNYILGVRFEEAAPLHIILRSKTFAKNILRGRHCDKCHTTADSSQTVRLASSPDILVLQLLRFRSNGTKKTARIAFDDELDLTPFTFDHTPVRYQLRSVVHHRGTMDFGHYKTVAKGPAGWVEMDDSKVSRARFNDAQSPAGNWTPYILFWTRTGADEHERTRM